jgi:hypothetical protein
LAREEGARIREKLLSPIFSPSEANATEQVNLEQLLTEHGVPTREEIRRLNEQIEILSVKLEGVIRQEESKETPS